MTTYNIVVVDALEGQNGPDKSQLTDFNNSAHNASHKYVPLITKRDILNLENAWLVCHHHNVLCGLIQKFLNHQLQQFVSNRNNHYKDVLL